jgi:metalloendopeptidase OMA1, mitochondrial
MTGGKMWSNLRGSLLAVLVLFLSGCATYNTATGKNELIFISTSSEVKMGTQLSAELSKTNRIITGTPEAKKLETIGQRVARVADRQEFAYHFYLIDSDEFNAFTIPGGHIYFYAGLFRKLTTDDQIASVLAHEVGHAAAKHTVKKFQSAMGYNIAKEVAVRILAWRAPGVENLAALGADGIMTLAMSAYSRRDEYEADTLGIKYLYLAGYDLNGMIQAFETLDRVNPKGGPPLILRSHPYIKDRIAAVKKEIGEVRKKY